MKKTRQPPDTDCQLALELWDRIEKSGKGYHTIEREVGMGRGSMARMFRGKFSRLILLGKVARAVGADIRLDDKVEAGE